MVAMYLLLNHGGRNAPEFAAGMSPASPGRYQCANGESVLVVTPVLGIHGLCPFDKCTMERVAYVVA
jgi:hypothetical protein